MALRRREKRTAQSKLDATPPWDTRTRVEPEATTGPFDERDVRGDELTRIDLGALQVPLWPGVEVRLDLNEAQQVVFATLISGGSQLQLGVFAAPRAEDIWDEIRAEIAAGLKAQGARTTEADGPWGKELVGAVPTPDGQAPARFIGVQGPRWFLRGMLIGPAVQDSEQAVVFEDAFRQIVVVRGNDPLPVKEPVPLTLPKEAVAAQAQQQENP